MSIALLLRQRTVNGKRVAMCLPPLVSVVLVVLFWISSDLSKASVGAYAGPMLVLVAGPVLGGYTYFAGIAVLESWLVRHGVLDGPESMTALKLDDNDERA
jgi:hypothetical protein